MLPIIWLLLSVSSVSQVALGCEGECIVNVTKYILLHYSVPVYNVFYDIAGEIDNSIIPLSSRASNSLDYITPLLSSYEGNAYSRMETAIFPSYFHGKCEDPTTGIIPAGCPNPSCPVVCGTPGSMVYHFPKLRRIAFDTVHAMLFEHTRKDSDTHNAVERTVKRFANPQVASNRTTRSIPRIFWARKDLDLFSPEYESLDLTRRTDGIEAKLSSILESAPERLARACGYTGPNKDGSTDELRGCSWEAETVAYILRFP